MSGYHALKGFEYQAFATLDILLKRFVRPDEVIELRPEGKDDLDIRCTTGTSTTRHFYQIKKPRETDQGDLTYRPWILSEVITELLPNAVKLLSGNDSQQTWVLGDTVAPDVVALLAAGADSPTPDWIPYLTALHRLVRNEVDLLAGRVVSPLTNEKAKKKLDRWALPALPDSSPVAALPVIIQSFQQLADSLQVSAAAQQAYATRIGVLHAELPNILRRITLQTSYGTDQQLRIRIEQELATRYGLPAAVVSATLLGNLRSFIQDIATQKNRWITREEFELELRNVWPTMTRIADPPVLPTTHVYRPALTQRLLLQAVTGPLAVVGASGAGKTALAREVLEAGLTAGRHVLYAAVQPEHSLRDVLSGVAFYLRRWGMTEPFRKVGQPGAADAKAIWEIGAALQTSGVLLLIDLVQGTCGEGFAKELAELAEVITASSLHLLIFGQENGLRALPALQRRALGLPEPTEVTGLAFDEFATLVEHYHGLAWDQASLHPIFDYFTAGRSAGLLARLADALARCATPEAMRALMRNSPEDALAAADQARYTTLSSPEVKDAANRLVCFALPFRLAEAETVFSAFPIRAAVRELEERGLLRRHDAERWEMHETVRAGLESLLPLAQRHQTHQQLAAAYAASGDITSQILHLEWAGQAGEAHGIARTTFIASTDLRTLAPLVGYLGTRRVVPAAEVATWLADEATAPVKYLLLAGLLSNHGTTATATVLLQEIRRQADRFDQGGEWARYLVEAVLRCDAASLEALLTFSLEKEVAGRYPRLDLLELGLLRVRPRVTPALLKRYEYASVLHKVLLTRFLVRDVRREVLQPVLHFVGQYVPADRNQERLFAHYDLPVKLASTKEVAEFLAALPPVPAVRLVVAGTLKFGQLADWIWQLRRVLQPSCLELLQAGEAEDLVLRNALRVLLFLGEERGLELAASFTNHPGELGHLAAFAPVLAPATTNLTQYQRCLFDLHADLPQRLVAFTILIHLSADVDSWYQQLVQADPEHGRFWQLWLLLSIPARPTLSALPLLATHLASASTESEAQLLSLSLVKLAYLPDPAVTDLLLQCLNSPWQSVSLVATLALQRRRSSRALPALLTLCQHSASPAVRQNAFVAALASGPCSAADFAAIWPRLPVSAPWRCILAGRLRAEAEAPYVVRVALDITATWQARRAAILAAGYLPFTQALALIYAPVLAEAAVFALVTHGSLLGHQALGQLLPLYADELRGLFLRGAGAFTAWLSATYEGFVQNALDRAATPDGLTAAQWAFDRLTHYDWLRNEGALEMVLQELHRPLLQAAVFKSLRRAGQFSFIEQLLPALSSKWLLVAAVAEWGKPGRYIPEADWLRLNATLASRTDGLGPLLQQPMDNLRRAHQPRQLVPVPYQPPAWVSLTYAQLEAALATDTLPPAPVLVLTGLTTEQVSTLARELDPRQDFPTRWVAAEPRLGFTADSFTVHGTQLESQPQPVHVRQRLRPALAAAAGSWLIPWHATLLTGTAAEGRYQSREYRTRFLASLGAQQDGQRLYEELSAHAADLLLTGDEQLLFQPLVPLLDERLVPLLLRFAEAGPNKTLFFFCWLATHLSSSAADFLLERLFRRWVRQFTPLDVGSSASDFDLWQAFNHLKDHPRFRHIPHYDLQLEELLAHPFLPSLLKQSVINTLADCPSAYARQELLLLQTASFDQRVYDEIDSYETNANALFSRTA
ncbi:MAG: hypothetical protein EOO63_00045 [Hymenobacter sp.]|nr:MAG: hypothetical protein EOO63_00045 [Hymenobacter sp.]